ncbi:MAG TPA: hypothetical protein VNX29_04300 [Kaistia sp.]|nr:hypothetical protein [Kaistia sp.]
MRKAGALIALIVAFELVASGAVRATPADTPLNPVPSDPPPGAATLGTWYCLRDLSALARISFDSSGVQVNNFAALEDKDFLVDAPMIKISASVVNRSTRYVGVSIEYIGIKGSQPIFAVAATPSLAIGPNRNEVVDGAIFTPAGTLAAADFGCLRVMGYRSAKDALGQ